MPDMPSMFPPSNGIILQDTYDAAIIVEAALTEVLPLTTRRLSSTAGENIASGHVYVYTDQSGITRWTDGHTWSPSRCVNNFLAYQELHHTRTAQERDEARARRGAPSIPPSQQNEVLTQLQQAERSLAGALDESYRLLPGGLVKRSMYFTYQGLKYHVVNYFTMDAAILGQLARPGDDPRFAYIAPREELVSRLVQTHLRYHVDPMRLSMVDQPPAASPSVGPPAPVSAAPATTSAPFESSAPPAAPASLDHAGGFNPLADLHPVDRFGQAADFDQPASSEPQLGYIDPALISATPSSPAPALDPIQWGHPNLGQQVQTARLPSQWGQPSFTTPASSQSSSFAPASPLPVSTSLASAPAPVQLAPASTQLAWPPESAAAESDFGPPPSTGVWNDPYADSFSYPDYLNEFL